ncbi:MAG: substrate-binding domain-containing protein [Chloroflexi bacterium]|nr:substrate-binding domain-containing protein [Chloroflexota bacterium]
MHKNHNHTRQTIENSRPTIGLLIHDIAGIGGYESAIWAGINDATREYDANLICFLGGMLHYSPYDEFSAQRNVIYDLVTSEIIDGLIISSSLGSFVPSENLASFCNRYRPVSMVSIALAMDGIPSVLANNYNGMCNAIVHLIETHKHRRIAFIRGPEKNEDADQRYQAYTDTLTKYDLPLDPDLVTPGDFAPSSGVEAIRLLLDERKTNFDAIVASDDTMALGALNALQERGIRVPYDIALVGFDDAEEASAVTPSLTTVRQPIYELGKRAVEILLTDTKTTEQITVPTQLIVRQSCGCLSPATTYASAGPVIRASETLEVALATQRQDISAEIAQVIISYSSKDTSPNHIILEWTNQLLDSLSAELKHTERNEAPSFLSTLDKILRQVVAADGDVTVWHKVLSALRRYALPYLASNNDVLSRTEDLLQQARVIISEVARHAQTHQMLQAKQQAETLLEIGESLITTFDITELMDEIAGELPRLGIPSCYLSLYEGKEMPPKWSRLIMAYDEKGRIELKVGGRRFPTHQLVPSEILQREKRYSQIIEPLFFHEDQIGFVVFGAGAQEGSVYEVLLGQLSSALKGAMILQERKQAEEEAQRRAAQAALIYQVGHRVSAKLDLEALLSEVVNAVRDTFDYYGVLLMLLDQETERLTLQSVTGGYADLFPDDFSTAVGEGMIGQAAKTGKTQISGDVRKNPYFIRRAGEKTKSELAVPIKSGHTVIAVIDLQSDEFNAFNETDVMAMETLADQTAVAIENARLYKAVQNELAERKQVEEQLQRYTSEVEHANKEIKRFAYIVSHDLRTPLVNLRGFASELDMTLDEIQSVLKPVLHHLDEKQRQTLTCALQQDAPEALDFIDSAVTRMDRFINALLKLSRLGRRELEPEPVDVNAIVESALQTMAHQIAAHNGKVTVGSLNEVIADQTSMEQIIGNILDNAVKYLSPDRPAEIEITSEHNDDETIFYIRDNGHGIAEKDMDKIFTPFRRAGRQDVPGEGMGLAYVRALIRQHEGRIWYESKVGVGTTFAFTIPNHHQEGDKHG